MRWTSVISMVLLLAGCDEDAEEASSEPPPSEESAPERPQDDPMWHAYLAEAELVKLRYYTVPSTAFDDAEAPGIAAHNKAREKLSELLEGADWETATAPLTEIEGVTIAETELFSRVSPPAIEGVEGELREAFVYEAFGLTDERRYPHEPMELGAAPDAPTYLVIGLVEHRDAPVDGFTDAVRECLRENVTTEGAVTTPSGCL